ncbi:ATP-binding protein [Paeniclostridium sordellii]|uniref:ATP-binding protein n=1 Tax=Paraclostridium sordellii TaxID=1505 RepID=UPI00214A455A|nr:ATP-binding protein [Paeniclostridium sordellii]MCR1847890.1 ATP-binding protein [Paeniclostridium sordellii]
MIDNSINARKDITTNENPCIVKIEVNKDYILISDNSGGINNNITDSEMLKIEYSNKAKKNGIGMKKSLFTLGDTIEIISNKKDGSRRFYIDMTTSDEELLYNSENIEYNKRKEEGTQIYINNLEDHVKDQLSNLNKLINNLGRIYSKFIENRNLIIFINNNIVKPIGIDADKINSCEILDNCKIDLYRGENHESSGVEIFVNDYMIYDREEGKKAVKLSTLRHSKYTYRNCIVEVSYHGDESKFENDKNKLIKEIRRFINENKNYFRSKTIRVEFDVPIDEVEELKEYYNEDSAKAIGIRAFYKMYEEYKNSK